jgi:hypothetical protein
MEFLFKAYVCLEIIKTYSLLNVGPGKNTFKYQDITGLSIQLIWAQLLFEKVLIYIRLKIISNFPGTFSEKDLFTPTIIILDFCQCRLLHLTTYLESILKRYCSDNYY